MHAHRPALLAAPLVGALLTGCLLTEDDCGVGFVAEGNRCLPAAPPAASDAAPGVDAAIVPDTPDAQVATAPEDGWGPYTIVALLDQTPRDARPPDPATAGADIDAIVALPATDRLREVIGVGRGVVDTPGADAAAVVGVGDGRFLSLGAIGGRLFVELELQRPLESGHTLWIQQVEQPADPIEPFTVYLCRAPLNPMEGCQRVGDGDRLSPFVTLP